MCRGEFASLENLNITGILMDVLKGQKLKEDVFADQQKTLKTHFERIFGIEILQFHNIILMIFIISLNYFIYSIRYGHNLY